MKFLSRIEKFVSRFAVRGLMKYIVILTGIVLFMDPLSNYSLSSMLGFSRNLILQGQIWRLFTFIFVPQGGFSFFTVISLIFYWWVGNVLEQVWGTVRFNTYYFLGVVFTIIGGFLTGFTTIQFINLSLFLAYASFFPDNMVYLMFVLRVKMKYLAIVSVAFLLYQLVATPSFPVRLAIVISMMNFLLFFGPEYLRKSKRSMKTTKMRKDLETFTKAKTSHIHKCTVCGITEKDDPDMQFRFCSKCVGHFEYCEKHISNHEHRSNVINIMDKKKKID